MVTFVKDSKERQVGKGATRGSSTNMSNVLIIKLDDSTQEVFIFFQLSVCKYV